MPKRKPTPEQLAAVKELAKQWGKIVAKNAYGPGGPPLDADFDETEQIAAAATAGLVEGLSNTSRANKLNNSPTSGPVPPARHPVPFGVGRARSSPVGPPSRAKSPSLTAPTAGGIFLPMRTNLELDPTATAEPASVKLVGNGFSSVLF
ncbi:MAG: hypothetical protein J0I06_14740 [Planctomycetes bacterium]|nr:hypothetical protein [Planctomycetota bacterium]